MHKPIQMPIALTIAGSDSGGGAGIQADLKTFASLGLHGTSAITCITAQNPKAVSGIHPCPVAIVRAQLAALFSELPPAAIKTGMLFSPAIVAEVTDFLERFPNVPVVVDPVMIATSGARLSKPKAIKLLTERLLPRAALVTPNLSEAEVLIGRSIKSAGDLRDAARRLYDLFGCPALAKGGHLPGTSEAIDFLYDGKNEWMLSAPYVKRVSTHGTGCTYSAAIAGYLALGQALPQAVAAAKTYITQAISRHSQAGKYTVLNHFWNRR